MLAIKHVAFWFVPELVLVGIFKGAGKFITVSGYCYHCGYNLYGTNSDRCPECGSLVKTE
jgi:predicted Zn-ribbon and HTH transcriptional regulator